MIHLLTQKPTIQQLKELQEEFDSYIKIVVDIEKRILCAGGKFHIDCEEILIKNGSQRKDVFGGGYDLKTKEVDFFAMSNYKPADGHITYEISDPVVRKKLTQITKNIFEGDFHD